ncbi:MAG: PEP/pyruvate-binding domain-containing protein, partial [Gammaproteobacteria bacterium]
MQQVLNFSEITMQHLPEVGGKNASLGEMINNISCEDIKVPTGFATTASAYRQFLEENKLTKKIELCLESLDTDNLTQLKQISADIREMIVNATFSSTFIDAVSKEY